MMYGGGQQSNSKGPGDFQSPPTSLAAFDAVCGPSTHATFCPKAWEMVAIREVGLAERVPPFQSWPNPLLRTPKRVWEQEIQDLRVHSRFRFVSALGTNH